MGVKRIYSMWANRKAVPHMQTRDTRDTHDNTSSNLPTSSSSFSSLNSISRSFRNEVRAWTALRPDVSCLEVRNTPSPSSSESSLGVSEAPSIVENHTIRLVPRGQEKSSESSPSSPNSEGRASMQARTQRHHHDRLHIRSVPVHRYDQDSQNADQTIRATDFGVALRNGYRVSSVQDAANAIATDMYHGDLNTELPPAYVARTPGLPTYDAVMRQYYHQRRVGRVEGLIRSDAQRVIGRRDGLPVYIERQRRRNDEALSRRRELERVEALLQQERQRPMRERQESHERRVQAHQERIEVGSPLGAFRGSELLNDRDMDVLLRAFGSPAY